MSPRYDNSPGPEKFILIDICIHWGREKLLNRLPGFLDELNDDFREETTGLRHAEIAAELLAGLQRLEEQAKKALLYLWSDKTLYLTENDALFSDDVNWNIEEDMKPGMAVNRALGILDDTCFFCCALDEMPDLNPFGEIADRAYELLDRITTENRPPSHRLIPLNKLRRQRIEAIPKNDRYLFPWYQEWCDLPPETISLLADRLAGLPVVIPPNQVKDLALLQTTMVNDTACYERLTQEAVLCSQLPFAIEEDVAWHLIRTADLAADNGLMPQEVVDAGPINAAIRVAVNAIFNHVPRTEWLLQAAFCGIGLNDEERVQLLETILDKTGEPSGPVSRAVAEICTNKNSQEQAESIFRGMEAQVDKVCRTGFVRIPAALTLYLRLLTSERPEYWARLIHIIDQASNIFALPDRMLNLLAGLVSRNRPATEAGAPAFAPAFQMMGEESGDREETVKIDLNLFLPTGPLPMPSPVPAGFGNPLHRISLLSEPATEELKNRLQKVGFYWGGSVLLLHQGQAEERTLEIRNTGFPVDIEIEPEQECLLITLGIAHERTLLERACRGEQEAIGQVSWIVYFREEEEPS